MCNVHVHVHAQYVYSKLELKFELVFPFHALACTSQPFVYRHHSFNSVTSLIAMNTPIATVHVLQGHD